MMSTQLRRSFEESNPMKKQVLEQWLLENVDDNQQRKQHVICFLNATSFYQTSLLDTRKWQPEFKDGVLSAIVDRDMKEDLMKCGVINWCRNASSMIPVNVPKDGNCLLHSVATAVWGISDTSLMFRRLLCLALGVDKDQRFRSRWLHHRQRQISQFVDRLLETGVELMDKEWLEIHQCLEPDRSQSVAVPHRFLESIHVYALANILRRPIIVLTDSTVRTYSGLNLQDNDMGGIYLPLEWSWTDTCHSPILLGYSQSHFCPLLFAGYPNQTLKETRPQRNLAPLVNSKFEQLPVRFLLQGEEPEVGHLLGKYLKIKETVTQVNGRVQNVLCADVEVKSMPENLDIVADYVQDCVQRFQQGKKSLSTSQHLPSASPSPQAAGVSVKQKHHPQGLPHNVRREQLQGAQPSEYALGDPTLHTTGLGQPQINIPPPSFRPRRSLDEQNMSLNAPPDKKCVVPTCKYYGDPCLAMMCSSCFKNYSIRESRKAATAAARPSSYALLASVHAQEAHFPLSMMNEKCKENCGFFCSTKTFPYCHECAGKLQRQSQEKTMAAALGLGIAPNDREKSPALFSSGLGPQDTEESREVSGITTMKMTSSAQGASPASHLPTGGAPSHWVEADPRLHKISPLSTTQMMEENWTQAMVTGELPCPEPGTEDPSSQQLFGSGESFAMPSIHAGQAGSATGGEPQVTPSTGIAAPASGEAQLLPELQDPDLVTPAAGTAPILSEPEAGDVGQNTQQTSSSVPDRQEHQLNASGQDISSAASLAKSLMGPTTLAGAGGDAEAVCTNQGCNEPVLHKSLCGKCYVGQDLKGGEPVSLTEEKTKMMSIHSTSSSAPASVGPAANIPRSNATFTKEAGIFSLPESRSQPSSLRDLRNIPPMNYTQSWIHDNQFVTSPLSQNAQAQCGPHSPPQGLPEKPESEPLGNDLIASGAECFSSTQHCIGDGCGNAVPQAGKLCQQCQDILRQARQASGASASGQAVQERPEQPKCRTERCSFYGIPENCGYCTKCYGKHVEREIQPKSHHGTPAHSVQSPSSAPRSPHTIIVPPDFNYACTSSEQQGQLCVAAGCRLFGDPKMAGMCYSHYQQHCHSIAKATRKMPAASKRQNVTGITYAPEVFITPSSVTIFRQGDVFPPPQVSVPPPPFPTGTGVPSIPQEPSLGETYYRVAGHPMGKCLNPACSNYGNHSKRGLCNSCANDQRVTDDLISRAIYGDEEVG